jgi:hypothetical protein
MNEMHLAENRQWWTVYDPLVLVVTVTSVTETSV